MVLSAPARDHLAGVDPRARRESDTPGAIELPIEGLELFAHLDCRSHGPQRIVLVQNRRAKGSHHGVADVLLASPTVPFQDCAHLLEVARHKAPKRFGVELSAETCRAHE